MKLGVIGTGYVGLVTGTCFAEMGNDVICVDNNQQKLSKLRNKEVPIYEPGLELLFKRNIEKGRLHFTDDLNSAILEADVIFLCLPTPQGEDGSADLKYVFGIADDIGKILKDNPNYEFKVIVNKSTVPVGTAKAVTKIINGYVETGFEVVSNPEFLREGYAVDDFMKPDRIVIGATSENVKEIMSDLYEPFVRQGNPILIMEPESSEVTKYAANSYLAMRITFMNELANFCESVEANVDMVRRGMGADTRIGKRFLFPGIGYGGSCFPKDVNALLKTSVENHSEMTLLAQVDKINKDQKLVLVKKITNHFGEDLTGKHFAVWGLAFKPNTDDMREAPAVVIINRLLELGATVSAYDPAAMENTKFYLGDRIEYKPDQYSDLENADALLILTEWNEFRNPEFSKIETKLKNKIIFDGRNVYDPEKMAELGYTYYSIGRIPVK
ncbi:MAG: UDP-glucose/GDP-mannose dehydrogenase family protein [Melioribacteraceae bacterium]|nr:UDP-glucose/GDP-mannose dehydrogenase family protein [Melioribacteraceae bacterium]MCF8264536.1 UDP-glucose/GDP-mannose dehydrogenase family protein [Melioribacteraceae bacterium]